MYKVKCAEYICLGEPIKKNCDVCNQVHLHIVFVLYSVCHSISVLSCVDIIQSFMYVLRVVILVVTKRHGERAREKARGGTNGLSQIPSRKEMKF